MKVTVYKCDQCQAVRGESNHWLLLWQNPDHPLILMMSPWHELSADAKGVLHICGMECLMKKASQLIERSQKHNEKSSAIPPPADSPDHTYTICQAESARPDAPASLVHRRLFDRMGE